MRSIIVVLLLTATNPVRAALPPLWMLMNSMPAALAPTGGGSGVPSSGPGLQCRAAIDAAERQAAIPPHLMAAIGRIESGRRTESGSIDPWPWSINALGIDHVYNSKPEAIAAVRALQAQGIRSIDVGCMQVNLQFHPEAFASLDDAFDPARNTAYAARFLTTLRAQTGSWETATAWYHSATPELGADYQRKVMAVLPQEQQHAPVSPIMAAATPAGAAFGRGALMLTNRAFGTAGGTRFLPMAGGMVGRNLASYRAAPIPIASRVALR